MEEEEPLNSHNGDTAVNSFPKKNDKRRIKRKLGLKGRNLDGNIANETPNASDAEISEIETNDFSSAKKKCPDMLSSGSEEYLLGFNENGVAELVKEETESLESNSIHEVISQGPAEGPVKLEQTEAPPLVKQSSREVTSPVKSVATVEKQDETNIKIEVNQKHVVAETAEPNAEDNVDTKNSSVLSHGTPLPLKSLDTVDDFYKKPFEYGWKRELVWRSNYETSKVKADVYFISPGGKKVRNRCDISPLLKGDLTLEHFSFTREPMGLGVEFETIRYAKPGTRQSAATATIAAATPRPSTGKRISKPKGAKGASPPPQGWTPTRALKVNNQHEPCTMSCSRGPDQVPQLKCVKCLCLFHQECVTRKGREYICASCNVRDKSSSRNKSQPARSTGNDKIYPQSIRVLKGKKYVMVSEPITKHDIENDLKQINESIKNSRKPSMDVAVQTHKSITTIKKVDHSNKVFATNFFSNISLAYNTLVCVFKYLKIHERPRAASVCKLWRLAAKETSLWSTVRMKNSKVCNWSGFSDALRRGETKHLDLRKMLLTNARGDDMWQEFSLHIGGINSLEVIDLCRCAARVVESLFSSNQRLRVLNAMAINDEAINLENINLLTNLEELRLRTCETGKILGDLEALKSLTKLKHLSLTGFRGLGYKNISIIQNLTDLNSLELGECGDLDSTFALTVLPQLKQLRRLRLENGQESNCCVLEILESCAELLQLHQLELINFDIKPGFETALEQCSNIQKFLLIPTYISQSATTNHIILQAAQQLADTLRVFTWGVTVELLRVTALYVEDESPRKQKQHFDECIPVLKPVPGKPADIDDMEDEKDLAAKEETDEVTGLMEIEILPLEKVQSILDHKLPQTKFTIVKLPYNLTCRQQLVE